MFTPIPGFVWTFWNIQCDFIKHTELWSGTKKLIQRGRKHNVLIHLLNPWQTPKSQSPPNQWNLYNLMYSSKVHFEEGCECFHTRCASLIADLLSAETLRTGGDGDRKRKNAI